MDNSIQQAVREVFAGRIRRANLHEQTSSRQQAYIGVAILLAMPPHTKRCIDGRRIDNYQHTLDWLLNKGVHDSEPYNTQLTQSRAHSLHRSRSKGRIPFNTELTPPEELVALVAQLGGYTEAIRQFVADADSHHQLPAGSGAPHETEECPYEPYLTLTRYCQGVIGFVESCFGVKGLRRLRQLVGDHLQD